MRKIKGIIFDLDGVLVFTDHCHYLAWKRMADRIGVYFDERINNRLRGVSRMASLEIILERYVGVPLSQEEKQALADEKNGYYRELLEELTPADVTEEVRRTLAELRRRGMKLAIGSSSRNARTILERVALTDAFDAISDGSNITNSKPDPEVFLKAAAFLGLKPADCAVVEDAFAGIDAALAGGMMAVGIGEAAGYERTAYPIKSLGELPGLFNYPEYLTKAPFHLNEQQMDWVTDTLASMTAEEKAGQLFCVLGGEYAPERLRDMVKSGKVGGVLYRPVKTGAEIKADFAPLDEAAKIPLLKAANLEEGGSGGRSDGTLFGWPMLSAAADHSEDVRRFGRVCGVEGRELGINWTFSPVCDIDMNYRNPITNVRTFGSDVEKVKKNTHLYMEAVHETGVAACAKHFPGDGVDYRDQHLHPTYNTLSAEDWYASYGAVYGNLIENGLMSVMVGHIGQPYVAADANPALTEEERLMPASLSKTLLTDVLRGKLGFNGLITTDAVIMGGYCMAMKRKNAIPASIMAGCDMLVFNTDFEEDYGYIMSALAEGTLTMERLDEAVSRILALKAKVCFALACTQRAEGAAWHRECADRAITLVKSLEPDKLPMTPGKYPDIRLVRLGKDEILDGSVTEIAKTYLEKQGFRVTVYEPFEDDLHGTAQLPHDRMTLYFANYEQASNQTVVRIQWCPKHALDMPRFVNEEVSVFVSLANPYLLQDVPRVRTYINAYTATRATIELTIDKLMGKSEFTGVSPVDPFCGLPDTRL